MKKHLVCLFLLMLFLSGCISRPVSAAPTAVASTATLTDLPVATVTSLTSIATPHPSIPTSVSSPLPEDLIVAYLVKDELWLWKQDQLQLLMQQPNLSDLMLSDDGQWLLVRQRHILSDGGAPFDELWVIRTDGSERKRLVGSTDPVIVAGGEGSFLIDDVGWLPGGHEILFNTETIVEGPPGSWPTLDLYLVDLSGNVTRLAEPGLGGKFFPSPKGLHIALVTDSKIGVLDLASGQQRTLLEFQSVAIPSDSGPATPQIVWDPQGQFVMTAILPQTLYSPETYAGVPTQIWQLFVEGQAELMAEVQPFAPAAGIAFSPNLDYFFSLHDSCVDGMGMLTLHDLATGEASPLFCVWSLPQWVPDDEHFIYELDGLWHLSSISDRTGQTLDVLNVSDDPSTHAAAQFAWIDEQYLLLVLRSRDRCMLSVATLNEIVAEMTSVPPESCPELIDFRPAQ